MKRKYFIAGFWMIITLPIWLPITIFRMGVIIGIAVTAEITDRLGK